MLKRLARPLLNYINHHFADIHQHIEHVDKKVDEHLIAPKSSPQFPVSVHWNYDMLSRDERMMMLLGGLHAMRVKALPITTPIHEAEFSVFSQMGEDGIIQFLIAHLPNIPKTFVEFGVENYVESNTRFLLKQDYWRGLVLDGSESAIAYIRADEVSWRHNLTSTCAFITKDNINALISEAGFSGEIGILSIDIDGNDYWIWSAIQGINPVVVICEYNATFGDEHAITIPYQADFNRTQAHFSNLYFGASLPALCELAHKKGYDFVGCNRIGSNAFFVRRDTRHGFRSLTAKEGFIPAQFSESRNEAGDLSFLKRQSRLEQIADCLVYDVITNKTQLIREQFQLSKD